MGEDTSRDGPVAHWFEAAADHLGEAYLRYSFTKGTVQEVDFLVEAMGLEPGERILDVGCGPGRHSLELAARGFEVVGVDVADRFVQIAQKAADLRRLPATFQRLDARMLPFDGEFDAVISLCQGAFGLQGSTRGTNWSAADDDGAVLGGVARSLKARGRAAVSAFSAYFQVRWLGERDSFDAANGVNHETTELRDERGDVMTTDLWTSCFTPRELRLLAEHHGLNVDDIWSVEPGRYSRRPPTIDSPEYLLVVSKR